MRSVVSTPCSTGVVVRYSRKSSGRVPRCSQSRPTSQSTSPSVSTPTCARRLVVKPSRNQCSTTGRSWTDVCYTFSHHHEIFLTVFCFTSASREGQQARGIGQGHPDTQGSQGLSFSILLFIIVAYGDATAWYPCSRHLLRQALSNGAYDYDSRLSRAYNVLMLIIVVARSNCFSHYCCPNTKSKRM